MPTDTKRFRTWQQFKSDFENFLPCKRDAQGQPVFSNYLFRGQMDAVWSLGASFDRIVPTPTADRNKEYERWHRFFKYLRRHIGQSVDQLSDFEVAALAQHYGMPTRLLDWTFSPYIAAFFAFFDSLRFQQKETRDIAIWVLHTPTFTKGVGADFEIFSSRGVNNTRVRNQLGKFLINRSNAPSLDAYIEQSKTELAGCLSKFAIPATQRITALNDLLLMGISPIDLYPDQEGIAMYVRLRQALDGYKLGPE